jgi:hypothetical protein
LSNDLDAADLCRFLFGVPTAIAFLRFRFFSCQGIGKQGNAREVEEREDKARSWNNIEGQGRQGKAREGNGRQGKIRKGKEK